MLPGIDFPKVLLYNDIVTKTATKTETKNSLSFLFIGLNVQVFVKTTKLFKSLVSKPSTTFNKLEITLLL